MRNGDYLKEPVRHIYIKRLNTVDIINSVQRDYFRRNPASASEIYDKMVPYGSIESEIIGIVCRNHRPVCALVSDIYQSEIWVK